MKQKWKYLNKLSGRETESNKIDAIELDGVKLPEKSIPDSMSRYFKNTPYDVHSKIKKPEKDYMYLVPNVSNSIFMNPITVSELKMITYSLGNTNNLHDVPAKFMKLIIEQFADVLCELFNDCLDLGEYPDVFKMSRVVPIYKKGKKSDIGNYRPISLLPTLNKIFEKIIHRRIYDFLTKYDLLNNRQFGFREGYNTTLASFELIGDILPSFDRKLFTMALFVDFEKAFDTLDRKMLLEKCWKLGLRGNCHKLLASYFNNREQFIHVNNLRSEVTESHIGCIQGSNLGPLMFIIYANDMHNLFNDVDIKVITYADDTVIYFTGPDIDTLYATLAVVLKKFVDWCNYNKLSINYDKTKLMIFSPLTYVARKVSINGKDIETVYNFKYLGLDLDTKLKHTGHLKSVETKLNFLCGVTYYKGKFFDVFSAKLFYNAYVYSSISYELTVWGGILLVNECQRIKSQQNRLVKNLFSWHFPNLNLNEVYKKLNLLKVDDLFRFELMCFFYKHNRSTEFLEKFHIKRNPAVRTNRDTSEFQIPFPRINSIKCNHHYQMTSVWSEVPNEIRSLPNLCEFKKSLKTYYISRYL